MNAGVELADAAPDRKVGDTSNDAADQLGSWP